MTYSSIYLVLTSLEILSIIGLGIFTFFNHEKLSSMFFRLIFQCLMVVLNAIELPLDVFLDKPYGFTILLIIIWLVDAVSEAYYLGIAVSEEHNKYK